MQCFKCHEIIKDTPIQGLHEQCFLDWFALSSLMSFENLFARNIHTVQENDTHTSFFQGKFKKYSAKLDEKSYILKICDTDYPELPHVEYICNAIAKALNLNIPDFYLIRLLNKVDTFVARNFMDHHTCANLIHLYHFIPPNAPFDCNTILQIIEKNLGRMHDIHNFIDLCLFDALIGNHDRHGRNLGFIQNPKGLSFSPFYDNPSYLGIEDDILLGALHSPRGKIATVRTTNPSMHDYVTEFKELGFQDVILKFYKKALKIDLCAIVNQGFCSQKRKTALNTLIQSRMKELENGII